MALAGGEVGLVDRLDVGLGVGSRAALRRHSTDPAAAERGAGQAPAKNQPPASPRGAALIYTSPGRSLTASLYKGPFKQQWLIARVTREDFKLCGGSDAKPELCRLLFLLSP